MDLEISERDREGVTVLDMHGRLVVGEAVGHLRDTMRRLLNGNKKDIVLNLAEVDYIDSTGLGTLVICYTSAKKEGGMAKLLNLSKRNIELIVLTKLTTVFEVFNDEQAAVNSFFPNREIQRFDILDFLQQQEKAGE
ncbi:MAG TPA: STAS domain-containing protein [Bryobacteraceae bacterium]|nr:STAS domain-containing protein [Bryobacteraceae bacterium]